MADPLDINNESALEGFLRWLSRPGFAVRDVLHGNFGGAVRQGADFLLDPIDAVLPGDVLPELSRKESDFTEASDLAGGMDPGWKKTAVDIIGGIATDPLTYTGVGLAAKVGTAPLRAGVSGAANLASKTQAGAKAVEAVKEGANQLGHQVRSVTGNLTPSEPIRSAVQEGTALGGATARAARDYPVQVFGNVDPVTQRRAIELIRGTSSELNPGTYTDVDKLANLAPPASPFIDRAEQMQRLDARLAAMPWTPAEKAAVRDVAEKTVDYTREQWAGGLRDKVFSDVQGRPVDVAPADYLPGSYEMEQAAQEASKLGQPGLINEKSIRNSAQLTDYLNANKAKLDENLPVLLGDYGSRMGQAVKAAEIGQRVSPGFRSLAEDRGVFKPLIENMRAQGMLDDATVLETAVHGLPPREGMQKILATANRFFKQFATAGAFIPRPSFTTRNVVSGVAMVASNPEARGAALGQAGRAIPDILGSWSDGLRRLGIPMPKPEFEAQIESAIAASGGDRVKMLSAITDPTLREAVESGVLDSGFTTAEQMLRSAAESKGGAKNWRNWQDYPQAITKGSEERMRLGLFTQLREKGMPVAQAAKVSKDSLYDYAYSSAGNRMARDVIPFAQFTFKAIPQQTKFLMETGAVPSVARNTIERLYSQGNNAVLPPQLQDQPVIPFGRDEKGNPEYLTSFGMPYESLGQVPNLTGELSDIGPEIRHNLVSAANPGIKALYSLVSGSDPYFDTPFGSYDRAPYVAQALGADPNSSAARTYNLLAGSGMIQPIAAPVGVLSNLLDPRRTAGEAAVNALTGIRVKSVDEKQALQQLLEQELKKNPDVKRYESLYQQSPDADTQALLQELKKVKADIRKRRKAEKEQQ